MPNAALIYLYCLIFWERTGTCVSQVLLFILLGQFAATLAVANYIILMAFLLHICGGSQLNGSYPSSLLFGCGWTNIVASCRIWNIFELFEWLRNCFSSFKTWFNKVFIVYVSLNSGDLVSKTNCWSYFAWKFLLYWHVNFQSVSC